MKSLIYPWIPVAALILDSLFGDPRSRFHPVVLIGRVISIFEKEFYPKDSSRRGPLLFRGCCLTACVLAVCCAAAWLFLRAAAAAGVIGYAAAAAVILYFTITPHSLARDGKEICSLLEMGDLCLARSRLSWIVGRDTENLGESEIARGTIETIAENTVDGVISPLFWFLLMGPVGAVFYRAANTMDSMVGYMDERYIYFGRCSARLDDVLNFIPARLTFLLLTVASWLLHLDWRNAWHIGRRDASKHPSPNGGYAEAPTAGALHIRLGGCNYYDGKPEFRACMGDPDVPIQAAHIRKTIQLMYVSTCLFVAAATCLLVIW